MKEPTIQYISDNGGLSHVLPYSLVCSNHLQMVVSGVMRETPPEYRDPDNTEYSFKRDYAQRLLRERGMT